jgi:hypothetical protein
VPESVAVRWRRYTLLPARAKARVAYTGEGFAVGEGEGSLLLDGYGNPAGSPLWGRDLSRERIVFLAELSSLSHDVETAGAALREAAAAQVEDIAARYAELLEEMPYRKVFATLGARALAGTGELGGARRLLEELEAEGGGDDDLTLRLANLEALDGSLDRAWERLVGPMAQPRTARAGYDIPHLALWVAIARRDREGHSAVASQFSNRLGRVLPAGVNDALSARARLWWDEVEPTDTRVQSYSHAPGGEAVACLARWRLGATDADDPERMETAAERDPEAALEYEIATGAALLGLDHPVDALEALNAAILRLQPEARDDFAAHQTLELAQALRVVALDAAGSADAARREGEALSGELEPGLLPARLVEGVLLGRPAGDSGETSQQDG